jgi:hypothetical protein
MTFGLCGGTRLPKQQLVMHICIRIWSSMDPDHFVKLDPDPHQSEKQDPDPHRSQKQAPNPLYSGPEEVSLWL